MGKKIPRLVRGMVEKDLVTLEWADGEGVCLSVVDFYPKGRAICNCGGQQDGRMPHVRDMTCPGKIKAEAEACCYTREQVGRGHSPACPKQGGPAIENGHVFDCPGLADPPRPCDSDCPRYIKGRVQ